MLESSIVRAGMIGVALAALCFAAGCSDGESSTPSTGGAGGTAGTGGMGGTAGTGGADGGHGGNGSREDGAHPLSVNLSGSLQNPAWSPDSGSLLFTRFRQGYNVEPADLYVAATDGGDLRELVSDGSGNINLPGSSWNGPTGQIVFASTRDPHDEIYVIDGGAGPGAEWAVTQRTDEVAYEPSFSPDGTWVVFESHVLDQEDHGVITKFRVDGQGNYEPLTAPADDCRQPNWSPAGGLILYQRFDGSRWDIWVMNEDGSNAHPVTSGAGDKTDASFSPDGSRIVYSSDEGDLEFANLFVVPVTGGASIRVTQAASYDGAPSWSPNGLTLAFESCPGDPDESPGTTLYTIDAPP